MDTKEVILFIYCYRYYICMWW